MKPINYARKITVSFYNINVSLWIHEMKEKNKLLNKYDFFFFNVVWITLNLAKEADIKNIYKRPFS